MSRRLHAAAGLAGALLALTACGDSSAEGKQDNGGSSSGNGGAAPSGGTTTCEWGQASSANPYLIEVEPPEEAVPATGVTGLRVSTNLGDLTLTVSHTRTPCTAASLVHLTEQGFFDDTPCHRAVDGEGLQALQCGDPTGTGAGDPTYTSPMEVTGDEAYPRGTVAMVNSGQGDDDNGSQFILVWGDSQLTPAYTVVGTIDDAGLAVLDEVAANGNDGSLDPSPGGGAPNVPVTIESMSVV